MSKKSGAFLAVLCLTGCSEKADTYTLYRNSPYDNSMRVQWATFDASESDKSYNMNNCLMAARLLNANMTASAKAEGLARDQNVGFWCEGGKYEEKGPIPNSFTEAFPTDA